jgi:hypothetical protein
MRTLLLAGALTVVMAGSALACRGTTEYPQAFEQLEQSDISPERKSELREQLSEGQAMHEEGHSQSDMSKMGGSLEILDEIMKEIGE